MLTSLKMRPQLQTQMRAVPQLVIASKLLRASNADLESLLQSEVAANPALERIRRPVLSPTVVNDAFSGLEELLESCPYRPGILEQLARQVGLLASGEHCTTALRLLECLDEQGYLRSSPEQLARELDLPLQQVYAGLQVLHQLEPAGIGALHLQERLELQISDHEAPHPLAQRMIAEAWDDFLHLRWGALARALHCSRQEIKQAVEWMRRNLSPHAISLLDTPDVHTARQRPPDLIVRRAADNRSKLLLVLPGEQDSWLRIHPDFENYARADLPSSQRAWLRMHVERAQFVLQALQQRWITLRRIGDYLLEQQAAFFENGLQSLKPVTRTQAARTIGVHESTISRAVQDKTLLLPEGGLMPLADFFDPALPARACLQDILMQAGGKLTDQALAARMAQRGHPVSRRTVSKYRMHLNLPSRRV